MLSSLISYRSKRKTKAPIIVSSPFPVNTHPSGSSPHSFASPRILDINQGRVPAPSPNVPEPKSYYYNSTSTPRVHLDVEIDPEPLTDWFPTNFLNSDISTLQSGGETQGNSNGTYYGDVLGAGRGNHSLPLQGIKEASTSVEDEDEEEEEIHTLNSADEVLADLEAMDASTFVGQLGADRQFEFQQPSSKKPAPTPIKIPNASFHGPKVQLVRSSELSRPTSQISSPESSAISGTTLARALLGNSFVLSGETRTSRYRSGGSILTRTDSATLPREYSLIHSPYWLDRASLDLSLSPGSAPAQAVPPVPGNAELVYVPPQTTRQTTDARERRQTSTPGSAQPDREAEAASLPRQQEGEDTQASRRISRNSEATSPQPSTHQLAYPMPQVPQERSKSLPRIPSPPPAASDLGKSRRYSIRPESEMISEGIIISPSLSEAPSSAKDLDNVLDYYSFADTPEPMVERSFRPPFSPITEESSSQLSPPMPFRSDSRGSKRNLPPGRFFLGTTSSASIGGVRVDWNVRGSDSRSSRHDSTSKPLFPIGDRPGRQPSPNSLANSRPSASTSSPTSSAAHDTTNNLLLPPPASSVFNRLRSGSAPSPIKVVRDSQDFTAYNITVTPRTGSNGSTPTSGDIDIIQQTFPETPSAFSPSFSPNGAASPGMIGDYMSTAVPLTPMSAGNIQPSLAQQVLLTRAATSVHGARHSRQASLTRLMRQQGQQHASSIVTSVTPVVEDAAPTDNASVEAEARDKAGGSSAALMVRGEVDPQQGVKYPVFNGVNGTQAELAMEKALPEKPEPSPQPNPQPQPASPLLNSPPEPPAPVLGTVSLPQLTPTPPTQTPLPDPRTLPTEPPTTPSSSPRYGSEEAVVAYDDIVPNSNLAETSRAPSRAESKRSNASYDSPNSSVKVLPRIPPASPRIPRAPIKAHTVAPSASLAPAPEFSVGHSNEGPSTSTISSMGAPVTPFSSSRDPPPMHRLDPVQILTPIIPPVATTPLTSPTARRPAMINPPLPNTQLPPTQPSSSSLYSLSYDATMSPPPYYAVINSDLAAGEAFTPSTSASYDPNYRFGTPHQPYSPPPNGGEFVAGSSTDQRGQARTSSNPRRTRARPPLPAGPRRPSQQHGSPFSTISAVRERGGSISSIASQIPSIRRQQSVPLPSPRFPTPPPKWRGYTMDAAKWTFTSTQLQAIVSRAIRQSSEGSSIRLLRLETLDEEIPAEVERLESLRTETKMKYKTLARKRTNLLDSLANCVDGLEDDGPANAILLVEDLKDVCGSLDKLAEELHSVDEQLSQLAQLCQGHSTSALAMALRKLNGSFLKQFAEAQALRQQVETLEAERDEAWNEAQEVANDYEELRTGKIESPDVENRYDRVIAVRKSSTRATKAGLRPTSARSNQRASTGSSSRGFGASTPSSGRTTYMDDPPPVPPIPRRRPVDIMTNLPVRSATMRSSVVTGASVGATPNSETRAMVRAQEELYDMLGISLNDHRSMRSRSVIGIPGESEVSQPVASPSYVHYEVPPNTGRRASLPGSAALPLDPYNALTADVSIILTSGRSGWI